MSILKSFKQSENLGAFVSVGALCIGIVLIGTVTEQNKRIGKLERRLDQIDEYYDLKPKEKS